MVIKMTDIEKLENDIAENCLLVEVYGGKPDYIKGDIQGCNCDANAVLLCGKEKEEYLEKTTQFRNKFRSTKIHSMEDIIKMSEYRQKLGLDIKDIKGLNIPRQKSESVTNVKEGVTRIKLSGIQNKVWEFDMDAYKDKLERSLEKWEEEDDLEEEAFESLGNFFVDELGIDFDNPFLSEEDFAEALSGKLASMSEKESLDFMKKFSSAMEEIGISL